MGTKLRNISTNTATKIAAFILAVIFITASVAQVQRFIYRDIKIESLFIKEYKDSEDFVTNRVLNTFHQTTDLLRSENTIPQNSGFYYYVTDGTKTFSNTENANKSFFEKYSNACYINEKGLLSFGKNTNPSDSLYSYVNANNTFNKITLYIAFQDEFMEARQQEWQGMRAETIQIATIMTISIVLALALIIFLICVTGREPQDKEIHLSKLDRIYSDILFAALILLLAIYLENLSNVLPNVRQLGTRLGRVQIYSMIYIEVLTAAISSIGGVILLSLVRKIKSGKMLKHSLIFTVCYRVYDFFKSLFDGRVFAKYPLTKSLFYRQLVFISSSAALVFLTFLFLMAPPLLIIPPILEIVIIYWYIKGNNRTFEDINKGFNESLEEQMKAERMKIALVTNVSHDLKTPLTSIISYIDLLSKEEKLSETAADYVKILVEKSNRLKQIVSDLFDLAKSTSGNIVMDLERLDIKKLIEQTLADMADEIEKSEIQIKTKFPDRPVNIIADGKKLYRVFQNVMDNALKYSLIGTRVFVELEEVNGKAVATIKNIAGYEMDFTADEILQRFNRGDKSRNTEGSGLGLSIAESFTNVCGGDFKVDIDGDLFKVTICFNLEN
ncbi:alkaline phosphatase synthesis sensor protein PhoR [Clostridium homopropionicum DSM 5847]|uniref:histidine kinase n=1 Tax=Clostridium homopropionicum DSM 5847 TaxID=1121318 RepID=A0A0L6Z7F6_9CLOT|nr:HAMP domain-containing sensor histidine kinase [Clostridium homopropionicum]KOA18728.1 alkaline phosphatase synthesis sensor protein PhoR [Clostridium homopropionicum DSM 5847]SFG54077.1 Signal transduction histidine kinase [Clostridium homopropionicum]